VIAISIENFPFKTSSFNFSLLFIVILSDLTASCNCSINKVKFSLYASSHRFDSLNNLVFIFSVSIFRFMSSFPPELQSLDKPYPKAPAPAAQPKTQPIGVEATNTPPNTVPKVEV